ncbi:MAG: TetR/AcrR family transcriptional regulator [Sneathiellales bacterium]|nr:TetR/AcrR family transcriptional regulator [Sneathiellales bacterium]
MSELTKRQKTHEKILTVAGKKFRGSGYSGVGVDGIAKEAGVTSGAFYAHFGSKKGAFIEALEKGLDEVIERIPVFQNEHQDKWLEAFVTYYLGEEHRNDLEGGCAMTTLSSEVARSEPDIHRIYEEKMDVIAGLIANGLTGSDKEKRHDQAWAILGILIGGLNISRAVNSSDLARRISIACTAVTLKTGEVL